MPDMSAGMLPKFHVRNLRSSNQPSENQTSLVRISAPAYDTTISNHPAATLKYRDEDGDKITLGSSHELIDKLEEPISQPSASSSRMKKDRMSIAMLLSEVQQNPDAVNNHTFDIEEREEIQKLWQEIQQRNRTPPPPTSPGVEQPSSGHLARVVLPAKLPNNDPSRREVAKGSSGRNASACTLQTQALAESNMQSNDNRRNKLAMIYDRLKIDIWTPIAAELGTSWEEAEALHWALGKDEMTCRAEKLNASQTASFRGPVSVKSKDEDWHEDSNKKIQPLANGSAVQKFEDYRRHHFNATMPPGTRNAIPASQVAPKFAAGKAPYAGVAKPALTKETFPSLVASPVANLTTEGKRQAQAAGDILRSRTTPSRHRKVVTTTTDHTNHQNRWASYKSPNTAFSPKTSTTPSQGFNVPTLTLEGRRQAQAAGDKLRSRTNPIRHSRPSRSGSLEHGISKNRWASYVAPRIARFEERHPATADLKESSQSTDPGTAEQEKQPSLLEVFEAELAKSFLNSDEVTGEGEAPGPEVIDIPSLIHESSSSSPNWSQATTPTKVASPQESRALLPGVDLIHDYVQRLTFAGGSQEFSNAVDNGLRAATGAVEALARGAGRLHDTLGQKEQLAAAAVQREVDIKGIDDALRGLRDFVSNIATGFSWPGGSLLLDSPETNEKKDPDDESHPTPSDAVPTDVFLKNTVEAQDYVNSALLHTSTSTRKEHNPLFALSEIQPAQQTQTNDGSSVQPKGTMTLPRHHSSGPIHQTQTNDGSSVQAKGTMNAPRYHSPGPIHLPQAPPSRADVGCPSDDFRNVDHLRQSRNIVNVDKPATSPYQAATRFPTLAQFEVQNFALAPSFPALPSMEPLVPQRVAPQTVIDMLNTQTREDSYATDMCPKASQQQEPTTISAVKQNLINKGIVPTGLTDVQLFSCALQNPTVSLKPIQVYARNMARNQRQQTRSQDPEMEPIDNEGQDRNSLLKTRRELMPSEIASPNHQDGGSRQTAQIPIITQPSTPKNHALQDYQMQLMLLEQQNKKRLFLAQEQSEKYCENQSKTSSLATQQSEVEHRNEERPDLALSNQGAHDRPQLPGKTSHTQALADRCNEGTAGKTFGQSERYDYQDSFTFPAPRSAARLAEPFDPLDVEPSAQPQLSQAIRRNATVGGTDSRHNARRRRPYSEAFDGLGRVAWESFEAATKQEIQDSRHVPGMKLTRQREQTMKNRDRHQRMGGWLQGSPTFQESRLTSPFGGYDDEHQDKSTVDKIQSCMSQLRDLGFGSEEDESGDRLLVYAQAAEGDLVDALDMIDEEQEAYKRL